MICQSTKLRPGEVKMKKVNIPSQLRKAGVPRSCWAINCDDTGRGYINTWAEDVYKRFDSRESRLGVYVRPVGRESSMLAIEAVELHARQAVVHGVPGKYLTFSRLVQLLRLSETREASDEDIHSLVGRGFFAIPVLPTVVSWPGGQQHAYNEAMGFLHSHICEGGILLTSAAHKLLTEYKGGVGFPLELEKLIFDTSVIVEV